MTSLNGRAVRIAIVTASVLVAAALTPAGAKAQTSNFVTCMDPATSSTCVQATFNANVQLTNLHPAVTSVGLRCTLQGQGYFTVGFSLASHVVNRAYTGGIASTVFVLKSQLADPAARTATAVCHLHLYKEASGGNILGQADAVASAAQPTLIADDNWAVVASSSTITWTQSVTFPNATP